jgi:uncharacterized protein
MDKKLDPQHLDLLSFAREGAALSGEGALTAWPRLLEEQFGTDRVADPVQWHLQGRCVPKLGHGDEIWLDLNAEVNFPMQCQRCLSPALTKVQAQRSFRFVADEASAAALDDEAEEDILVISRDFDALALVEDELILSMPLVPLHGICPEGLPTTFTDPEFEVAAERPHPFAVLAGLKKGSTI